MTAAVSTSGLTRLWRWWSAAPADMTPKERRFHAGGAIGLPQGWLAHFAYIFLFTYWDIPALAITNIFSLITWTVILVAWRQRRQRLTYILTTIEVSVHAALAIHFLGWDFGGQYYLLLLTSVGFLLSWSRATTTFIVTLDIFIFISLYYYSEIHTPLATVPSLQLAVLNVLNTVSALSLIALIIVYFLSIAERAEAALADEHAKSEALLNNVLPKAIAARLKQNEAVIADNFPHASILFSDIVGFTPLSERIPPEEMIQLLDTIFSRFDELVDAHGLEKIKTVGDGYVVAAGVPVAHDRHAAALVHFALDMREALRQFNQTAHVALQLRIGINSGPVVGGVIGKRRIIYDLWGDAVNTAARMESHGLPGEIHISEATRRLLNGEFDLVDRGLIDVKGKGPMRTFLVSGVAPGVG